MLSVPTLILVTSLVGATSPTALAASSISSPLTSESQVELYPASPVDRATVENVAVNLARGYLGSRIIVVGRPPTQQPLAIGLLTDDVSYRYKLPAGKTTLIVSLTENIALNRFSFLIHGAQGVVEVSGATIQVDAHSTWWQPLATKTVFESDVQHSVQWPWSDMRYLRVQFVLQSEGYLSPIGIFGAPTLKDVRVVSSRAAGSTTTNKRVSDSTALANSTMHITQQINVASLTSKGRVAYVSSGMERAQSASVMLDNDLGSAYTFDHHDPNPTFIVEMAQQHPICRIATYCQSARPGHWEVYPLAGIPAAATAQPPSALLPALTPRGLGLSVASLLLSQAALPLRPLKMPLGFFDQNKPAFKIGNNNSGEPIGVVEFEPQPCRYVLLRWVADEPGEAGPIKVFQVSIFTDPDDERLDALPAVNFASIGPDLSGAQGSAGPTGNAGSPTLPVDPPRPRPVSP